MMFLGGLILGAIIGFFLTCLCVAAGNEYDWDEDWEIDDD